MRDTERVKGRETERERTLSCCIHSPRLGMAGSWALHPGPRWGEPPPRSPLTFPGCALLEAPAGTGLGLERRCSCIPSIVLMPAVHLGFDSIKVLS